ncbi:MAG: hypothetical protein A3C93_03070 [Candidatus Lloydbacteria bacterium RIFCSPHIGHO2_02_FULL_54_17]|uniref:Uncharacterized protein n=1 Tax=Candidatus Lloydbacteria bacterium RIFCSPHIGHO2_02_FULL_54_17 TaxID=1798664 RepID=A0A1G2DCN4_9BACT|nr:MAG: hypothetical protein A2762_04940 [Candidatus Lloydbacteria bacterium RIFCSPHIGHO2_01_FULL_54_11]OGZ10650.1 MAG: hypothetical protein A3C93_03070 [Candidatus Lloydbacteria bacterium RIFCSPHIGHO2_02_FULL_54_17]OGZ13685.1 MAG: hypothetical protein A2948_03260 [Candidatus Lloydbacteria bacterium RIFCSPLOWO2_01_FULL_54_18]OGZ16118.1 MAG: hypothetical protein A3H76_01720 [Candidatus Lloydbacteria bacterium RIFCSPLOWO2_02_FULL_54_12]
MEKEKGNPLGHLLNGVSLVIGFIISLILVGGGSATLLSTLDKFELTGTFTSPDWLVAPVAFSIIALFIWVWKYSTFLLARKFFKDYESI